MKLRTRPRDTAILAAFIAFWCALAAGKLYMTVYPTAQPVVVERIPGDAPVVREMLRPADARPSQLAIGDRIERIGATSVVDRGQRDVVIAFSAAGRGATREVPVQLRRNGATLTVAEPMPAGPSAQYLAGLLTSAWSAIVAVLILVRARPSRASFALFGAVAADALVWAVPTDVPPPFLQVLFVVGAFVLILNAPLIIRGLMAFPEEAHGLEGAWRWLPWVFASMAIPVFSAVYGFPMGREDGTTWSRPIIIASTLTVLFTLTRNYRNSGPAGRRQIKWLLYAVYLGGLLGIVRELLVDIAAADQPLWATGLLVVSKILFPAGILIAVTRYDLLDIDRLFGSTVLYNVLVALALGVGFLVVPRVADFLATRLDIEQAVGHTILTLGLAVVVLVVGRRVGPLVERLIFRERFALEQAMRELPERFAAVRSASVLWELTGSELAALLRPTSCVIYTAAGHAMLPAFVHGNVRATTIATDGGVAQLAGALRGARRIGRSDEARLDAAALALLHELDANVIVPIHRGAALEAMIVLGEKRSGDIYTGTDLTLLTSIGKTLSTHMLRFDEAELLTRAHDLQERMRRYVPGALADAIVEGEELETGEREVSVLFVDIRGYTAYADGREAREIFSTVNRYTEAVSSIVRAQGGVVVEFNGDGMMAVFGAPRPLADKEAAAVRCARQLATDVPQLGDGTHALAVGVGVATGMAFVGNIEAVDRTIWSAIGSTTNLAARLQHLTRERSASVLIDQRTHERAGAAASAFVRLDAMTIRGVSTPVTPFAWTAPASDPVPAPATASATAAR